MGRLLTTMRKRRRGVNLTSGLLCYFRLSDDATDSSGNGRTLTMGGGLTYGTGKISRGAASGDATGAALGGAARAINVTPLSIAGWINFDATWTGAFVQFQGGKFGLNLFSVFADKDPDFDTSGLFVRVGGYQGPTGPAIAAFSGWKHVALVWSPPTLTIYVNGAVHSATTPGSVGTGDVATSTPVVAPTQSDPLPVDEVAIYEAALTAEQVAALYNGGAGFDPTA